MSYWAGLFGEEDRKIIEDGVSIMLQIAVDLLKEEERAKRLLLGEDNGAGNN